MKISIQEALAKLEPSDKPFLELFAHGSLSVEVYKPIEKDLQQPHDRDEVYVVMAGHGNFYLDGKTFTFKEGDFIFVPAGKDHRFENFSNNFCTWVMFYGPKGGENDS